MTIYTSNFQRNRTNPNAVAICRTITQWVRDLGFDGKWRPDLAPSQKLLNRLTNEDMPEEAYAAEYLRELQRNGLTPQSILDSIPDGSVLLCYERPGDFCHRRVLADWIESQTGVKIPEWKNEKELIEEQQQNVVDSLLSF